jgi:hypothetical protein
MPLSRVNDFVVRFANVNGSGSASANELFARSVLPHLEDLWDDRYEDRWWPQRLRAQRPVAATAVAAAS